MPFIATSYRINRIEVWISDDRTEYQRNSRQICAITDIAEGVDSLISSGDARWNPTINPVSNPTFYDRLNLGGPIPLPDNDANPLYGTITDPANAEILDIDKTADRLSTQLGLKQTQDFEIFQGRMLSSSEYTYHPELGTISLNVRLRPNQVLGVADEYFFTANCNELDTVRQLSDGQTTNFVDPQNTTEPIEPPKITFIKLLKSSNQNPKEKNWDLMMKNVYSLRTSQLNRDDFDFDIFWQDDRDGSLKKFLDEPQVSSIPLLNAFNLDRLNRFGDPQPDGVFDFVPGITVNERTGTIIFPRLEPFGEAIQEYLSAAGVDSATVDRLSYPELYRNTVTAARNQFLGKNKFTMRAEVMSSNNGEINLGPFVPRNGVRVTAGGRQLVEGSDYEIDYAIGRLRIINQAYLQEGVPINVNFEDNAVFSLQQKTMMGLRADYEVNDKLSLGATFLRVAERPLTRKVNIGDDPIKNRVFGIDLNYSSETPWITNVVDKLPFYSTKAPSSVNFFGEAAILIPGTSNLINSPDEDNEAVLNIDDFEGAVSGFLLGTSQNNVWTYSSTPGGATGFPEHSLINDLAYNANRAKIAWYTLERGRQNSADQQNPFTRQILQQELFTRRDVPIGDNTLYTFDVSYFPSERGVYNFELPDGYPGVSAGLEFNPETQRAELKSPDQRWGGIMRYLHNTDFWAANYEFIEFWMLNPFEALPETFPSHDENERGKIIFDLGNVSEDILKDGRQFFENSLNTDTTINLQTPETVWGKVPFTVPLVDGFDAQRGASQDLGLDGLTDLEEQDKFQEYLSIIANSPVGQDIALQQDPCNDNFVFFGDQRFDADTDLITRFKDFNNPQGNAPISQTGSDIRRGNPRPDKEDLNNNRSLESGESFYRFELPIENDNGKLDITQSEYIRESREVVNPQNNNQVETWYRVQIPIKVDPTTSAVNGIEGFRSIQFMRMWMTGFTKPKVFRLAEFELVRNQWFRQDPLCRACVEADCNEAKSVDFNVDERGLEENSNKSPFGYTIPPGIQQERLVSQFANLRQDENSLSLNFCELDTLCEVRIHRLTDVDLTFYEKLELFVHLEALRGVDTIGYGDMSVFIRIGKDFEQNYYEYELPLMPSSTTIANPNNDGNVWPDTNRISIDLSVFTDLKRQRFEANGAFNEPFPKNFTSNRDGQPVARIVGNPSLGFIKMFQIGVRNTSDQGGEICGEAWINELRAKGLKNKGGMAAQARMQVKLADLGELNVSGNMQTIGWGALDQRVQERSREDIVGWDVATNLNLGKFFPESFGLQIPFYAQVSRNVATPQFDPLQEDLTVEEAEAIAQPGENVRERAQTTTSTRAYNFTNVKKTGGKSRKVYSPENISLTYAYAETKKTDFIVEEDNVKEYTGRVDYQFSTRAKYIEPFKFIKVKALQLISDFNFSPMPSSVSFNTSLNRMRAFRQFRQPDVPVFRFDDKRFSWDRQYGLKWDLTKNLKMNFDARTSTIIDELRQVGIAPTAEERPWQDEQAQDRSADVAANPDLPNQYLRENLRELGRKENYTQNLTLNYTVPMKAIPMMDWVNIKADYRANYGWDAASLIRIDGINGPGNVIQNSQDRSINTTLSFDKLYAKSKYLQAIEKGSKKSPTNRRADRVKRNRVSKKSGDNDLEENSKQEDAGDEVAQGQQNDRKKEKREGPSIVERILIRPLMLVRNAKLTYRESLGSLIPGFEVAPQYLGLGENFSAPGWGYVFGLQPNIDRDNPDNFLRTAAANGWMNVSPVFNSEINLNERHDVDLKINLEPFNDFKVDLTFNKRYQRSHREVFKNKGDLTNIDFNQTAMYEVGSFEATYFGLGTLFGDRRTNYRQFLQNREVVSQALGDPNTVHRNEDYTGFTEGFGPNNPDVAVPAFLFAYENKDVTTQYNGENLEQTIRDYTYIPKPNWNLTYDGLGKLGFMKNWVSNISIKHGYRSTIQVNNFNTTAQYRPGQLTLNPDNGNYFSRILIPALSIREQFQPLLGFSLRTKNDMNIDFEYSKSRNLDLRLTAEELGEELSTEITFGLGYTIKNFQGFGKKKTRRPKTSRNNDEDKSSNRKGRVTNSRGRNMTINCDISFRDDETLIYQLNTGQDGNPVRGNRTLRINPNVDYVLNDNLTLRFFGDYSRTTPKVNTGVTGITTFNTGVNMRFTLN